MLNPKLWGPYAWYLFHTITFSYQGDKANFYQKFLDLIAKIIPCHECAEHYEKHLIKYPPPVNNKNQLAEWMVDIHNRVNRFQKKKEYTLEEAENIYFVENILPINHQYIHDFIKIVSQSDVNPIQFIIFLQILAYIFPCPLCKQALINCVEKSYIKKIVNGQLNFKFITQYLNLINNNHLNNFDKDLLQKQNFTFNSNPNSSKKRSKSLSKSLKMIEQDKESSDEEYTEEEIKDIRRLRKKISYIKKNSFRGKIVNRATKLWKQKQKQKRKQK